MSSITRAAPAGDTFGDSAANGSPIKEPSMVTAPVSRQADFTPASRQESYAPTAPGPFVEAGAEEEPRMAIIFKWSLVVMSLLIAASIDYVMIRSLLEHLLRNEGPEVSDRVALGVTAISVMAMLVAGSEDKLHTANPDRARTAAWVIVAWAFLGLGLFVLRWWGASVLSGAADGTIFEGQTGQLTNSSADIERALAALMLGTYLLTGALAYIEARSLTNPAATALRRVRRRLSDLQEEHAASVAKIARHLTNLKAAESQIAAVDADEQNMIESAIPGLVAEAQAYARMLIAKAIGTPRGADIVHQPKRTEATPTGHGIGGHYDGQAI